MAHRDTSVSQLCRELGIRPVTLYRYVSPQGQLREQDFTPSRKQPAKVSALLYVLGRRRVPSQRRGDRQRPPPRASRPGRAGTDGTAGGGRPPRGRTATYASRFPLRPSFDLGRQHYARARLRVRSGLMVAKRDAEAPADVRQLRRADSPLRAGKLHGAGEPRFRRTQPVSGTARVQDAPVERRVVGGDERRVIDPTPQRRPQIGEGWGIMHVLPALAVESGERKLRAGWDGSGRFGRGLPGRRSRLRSRRRRRCRGGS